MRSQEQPPESRLIEEGDIEILTFETEENYQKLLDLYEENRDKTPKPGTFGVQYFRSPMDRSVQPYGLWVPKDYDKDTPSALIIQLHGISRSDGVEGKRVSWEGMVRADWIDEYTPVIQAQPLGRTNNSYSVMGEQDVLEVIEEVKRRFNVDPNRMFMMGHSMGGGGTMTIGMHYPSMFGALTPIDSAGGRETDNKWITNLFNQNVYIKDAGRGIGSRSDATYLDALIEAGAFATREVFPGMPHHFAPQRSYAMFVPQAVQQPIPANAPEVRFYTDSLRYNQAYWITVDRLIQPNEDSTLQATYDDGQPEPARPGAPATQPQEEPGEPSIAVETENISALTLELAGRVVPEGASMPLVVDGQTVIEGALPETAHLALADGKWQQVDEPALAGKRHGVQGPVWDAFTTPFLGVYGEGEGAKELAMAELDAVRAGGVFHGDFPVKSALQLTQEDIANYSLLLFGGPEQNSVVKRIAGDLPARLMEGVHDEDNGVILIQPNPENPERYVVVWTTRVMERETQEAPATAPRGRLGNRLRSLQDYAVVRDGRIAEQGYFDNNWNLD